MLASLAKRIRACVYRELSIEGDAVIVVSLTSTWTNVASCTATRRHTPFHIRLGHGQDHMNHLAHVLLVNPRLKGLLNSISIAGSDNPLVEVEYKGKQSNVILTTQGESTLKIFGD